MVTTPIDILLGSGYKDFTKVTDGQTPVDKMKKRGYTVIRNFNDFLNSPATKILALVDDSVVRPKMDGRGDYLPQAFDKVTNSFKSNPWGFFMMIEGSQIDHGGHNNNLEQVIVTADHETGGLTLLDGNIGKGYVWGDFSTNDHTGTPVPVFAYGPHAGDFRGVYHNTEIFNKLLALIRDKQ